MERFQRQESDLTGKLGVCVIDTGSGHEDGYRRNERFPFCSTFKVMLAGAVLKKSVREQDLLKRQVRIRKADLLEYAPITKAHLGGVMTVADLCAAALDYSDNTAANLLLKLVGGPSALNRFARSIGDTKFRLDRIEPALNAAVPGDPRDTTTPAAMVQSLRKLLLGTALPRPQRNQLIAWMRDNKVGGDRIRAGVPADYVVADKTGTGERGTANDISVLWPPHRAPIILVIYTTRLVKGAKIREDVIAGVARTVSEKLGGR